MCRIITKIVLTLSIKKSTSVKKVSDLNFEDAQLYTVSTSEITLFQEMGSDDFGSYPGPYTSNFCNNRSTPSLETFTKA